MSKRILAASLSLIAWAIPLAASAHEVYVLSANQITVDLWSPRFDMLAVALADLHHFMFWTFITALAIFTVFGISLWRPLERFFEPAFRRMRPYAFAVARVTVGIGLLSASYFSASFGPELPLDQSFGPYAHLVALLMAVLGTLIIAGFWARAAGIAALALYGTGVYLHGSYVLTYANYLGEFLVLTIIGSHRASVHSITNWRERFHPVFHAIVDRLRPFAFPILRVSFGVALMYASAYAKIIHNNLALQVASLPLAGHSHALAYYFGLEPHFLVLGAAIIEIALGLFFILGLEIRFASLFMLFWLALSLWYFGESVWPHIILIGIPLAFILHGYDEYSLEGRFFKRGRREPVL